MEMVKYLQSHTKSRRPVDSPFLSCSHTLVVKLSFVHSFSWYTLKTQVVLGGL